jgi:23S rRNA (adenine2030-N6)-methyltransferase
MQYRHSFHAGNFADVHKHVALLALLASLQKKAKGFLYLDTHAGSGLYDLRGEDARRGGESAAGIAQLEQAAARHAPRTPEIASYLETVKRLRALTGGATYPGSPLIAATALRDVDRGCCVEMVAQEARHLSRSLAAIAPLSPAKIRVETGDGYAQLAAQLPPKERRALVLIDPPFESADEFPHLAELLPDALRRFDSGVYAVWYPVKRQRDTDLWHARIARAVTQPTLAAEIWLHPRDTTVGLNGSGLLIVNPPWQSDIRLAAWQEELRELLGGGAGSGSAVKWIVHERN